MRFEAAHLHCDACDAAVHPFVRECPACGASHASGLEAASATPDLGIAAHSLDADVLDNVRMVVNYYRLREGGAPEGLPLEDGLAIVFAIVSYKVEGLGSTIDNAGVTLEGDDLVVRDLGRGRARAGAGTRVPLWSLLAAAGTSGRLTLHRNGGEPVMLHNRGGLLVSKPRPDHYRVLGRWLGPVAAAAAERRWTAVGAAAHAAEIGINRPSATAPAMAPAAPVPPAANAIPAGGAASPVADALRELDALRTEGLVSDEEYAAKRREILARI